MTSSASRDSRLGPREPLSVCLDDSPVLGGLSRGIRDLSAAVGGRILSLDSGRLAPSRDDAACRLTRVQQGRGILASRHLELSHAVRNSLDDAIAASDLVVCHSLYRAHVPFIRARCLRHGIPYWIVAHGMLDPWVVSRRTAWKRAWLEVYGRRCLSDAAHVLFSTGAELAKAMPWCDARNALVIPWPVDAVATTDRAACRSAVRGRLGLPPESRIMLSLSRYDSLKRPLHTVAAFAGARATGWHLVMTGYDGDVPRATVMAEADRLGPDRIHVLGSVEGEAKRELLVGSDAFVSLSWRENFGYALAEAAMAGLPFVAAPDHDLTHDMPQPCRRWIAADHSPPAAVRAIEDLMATEPRILEAIGTSGRVWAGTALSRSTFETTVRDTMAAFL